MIENIEYVITLEKPNGDVGKIILAREDRLFKTEWSHVSADEEELHLHYYGSERKQAWKMFERLLTEKIGQGYETNHLLLESLFSIFPSRYVFTQKLEYFSVQHPNTPLFEELKTWRASAASIKKIPPYLIATDKLLRLISTFAPQTEDEIKQLPGIGNQKFNLYGLDILAITKKYGPSYSFPLDWIEEKITLNEVVYWMIVEKRMKEQQKRDRRAQERLEIRQLLKIVERRLPMRVAATELNCSVAALLKTLENLSSEGYEISPYLKTQIDRIEEWDQILKAIDEVETDRLKPVYELVYRENEARTSRAEIEERYNRIRLARSYKRIAQQSLQTREIENDA